jgi:hypothetical protein
MIAALMAAAIKVANADMTANRGPARANETMSKTKENIRIISATLRVASISRTRWAYWRNAAII